MRWRHGRESMQRVRCPYWRRQSPSSYWQSVGDWNGRRRSTCFSWLKWLLISKMLEDLKFKRFCVYFVLLLKMSRSIQRFIVFFIINCHYLLNSCHFLPWMINTEHLNRERFSNGLRVFTFLLDNKVHIHWSSTEAIFFHAHFSLHTPSLQISVIITTNTT